MWTYSTMFWLSPQNVAHANRSDKSLMAHAHVSLSCATICGAAWHSSNIIQCFPIAFVIAYQLHWYLHQHHQVHQHLPIPYHCLTKRIYPMALQNTPSLDDISHPIWKNLTKNLLNLHNNFIRSTYVPCICFMTRVCHFTTPEEFHLGMSLDHK